MSQAPRDSPSVKRKVDDRVRRLIDDVVRRKHRGLFLIVGDRAKDQVVNLHWVLSCARHDATINVLWCMKEEPDFGSTGKKQQERRARREVKGGLSTEASKDALQTFLSHTSIRFCKYKETHKILGQTFDMAVLQDFEALTPNTLARAVETVRGGGLVILMLRGLQSLKQLHRIAMDVHAHYRTESLRTVVPRFNERFLLSLTDCETALCVDDDLNVLPITQRMRDYGSPAASAATTRYDVQQRHASSSNRSELNSGDSDAPHTNCDDTGRASNSNRTHAGSNSNSNNYNNNNNNVRYDSAQTLQGQLEHEAKLQAVQSTLRSSRAVGPLVQLCQTLDQAKTVLALMQTVSEKSLDTTCVVTAGRGRGKSAALGMAAAGAIAQGYSNIFCTAPSPENMQTFFQFAVRGLTELGYAERSEFEVLDGASEEFSRCVIRINVFRGHRQTIQFVAATDVQYFGQAELAIIDEAAALPLPLVKKIMGPYLVFLSSTVSGYEGTGRSLSLKLVADMRRRANVASSATASDAYGINSANSSPSSTAVASTTPLHNNNNNNNNNNTNTRLRELSMTDPVRYSPHDPIERWLNTLLCLDATVCEVPLHTAPHPQTCVLYRVNRDGLFSYQPRAEALLQRIQALLVAAHYKNQPNDLQLLADAPGHHLFLLCAPPKRPCPSTSQTNADPTCIAHNNNNDNKNNINNNNNNNDNDMEECERAGTAVGWAGEGDALPDIFCVAHVCEEGRIAAERVKSNLTRGVRPAGDLIPYTLSQYFLDDSFAKLAGMRVVRIATNPELQNAGYGSYMVKLLHQYFGHSITELHPRGDGLLATNISNTNVSSDSNHNDYSGDDHDAASSGAASASQHTNKSHIHTNSKAHEGSQVNFALTRGRAGSSFSSSSSSTTELLTPALERPAECVDYIGVSFGLTTELYNFWRRAGYSLLYTRQAAHELTGEHSCVMIYPFGFSVAPLTRQFRHRFIRLLAMPFRHLPTELALSVLVDSQLHDPRRLAEEAARASQTNDHTKEDHTHAAHDPNNTDDYNNINNYNDEADAACVFDDLTNKTLVRQGTLCISGTPQATGKDICALFTPDELRRLQLFTTAFIEGGSILDLLPAVAQLYFSNRLLRAPDGSEGVLLSHAQASVVCAVGLQCLTLEELSQQETFRAVPVAQLRAFYHKGLRLITEYVLKLQRTHLQQQQKQMQMQSTSTHGKQSRRGERTSASRADTNAVGKLSIAADAQDEAEETVQEVYDSKGMLCGLSVARSVTQRVSADTTLLRDAGQTSSGQDVDAQRDLQNVFRRPKKVRRRS